MKETKLLQLMKGLSAEDLRQIQKMMKSPFFTSNENLAQLFSLLRSHHPEMDAQKIEKQKVFVKLFPDHKYSDIKLRNLNSDLVRIIEDYLIYKEIKADKFARKKKLIKVYKEKGHLELFRQTLKDLMSDLEQSPFRDHLYYQEMLELKLLQLEFVEIKKPELRYETLKEWEDTLNHFVSLSKARHRMTLKSLKKIVKHAKQEESDETEEENILYVRYKEFETLYDSEDEELFEYLRKNFEEKIKGIRPVLQREFCSLLINFAIQQMRFDDEKYNQIVLSLYKLGLEHQLIFVNDGMPLHTAYYNIVVCGTKAKDFEWTLHFIEKYKSFLSEEIKEESVALSLSVYHYHQKDFSKAIDLLRTDEDEGHSIKYAMLKSTSRVHEIRCYYEIALESPSYFDLLIDKIPAHENFVRRNQFTKEREKSHLNFLKFIRKLAVSRSAGKLKLKQKEDLLDELKNKKTILSRSWLEEKIKE